MDISPISCGSSWHRTATLVDTPLQGPEAKATPMAIPSARLCIPSPRMTCDWSIVRILLSDWSLGHHPGHTGDGAGGRVYVTMGVAVAVVRNLGQQVNILFWLLLYFLHLMLGDDDPLLLLVIVVVFALLRASHPSPATSLFLSRSPTQ